ncbi:hypothetical protein [uncultured Endozoicomonas sp.]|uniref:hypothetical protein n=1 Tax=uncultured Endozoicomonas sp. TaxID=432652 RepID=UPI0026351B3A|nr:hypothetical protein [uncultured Endozoicomonas sp.]
MSLLAIIVVLIASLVAGSLLFWTLRLGIGPVPTSPSVQKTILEILPDHLTGDAVELGCGWGQLLNLLQVKYPTQTIYGYERSPIPAMFSQLTTGACIKKQDFFNGDFQQTGLILCYLYPGAMEKIEQKLIPELPSGCWIVTHTFSLRKRHPVNVMKSNDIYQTPVYLYRL